MDLFIFFMERVICKFLTHLTGKMKVCTLHEQKTHLCYKPPLREVHVYRETNFRLLIEETIHLLSFCATISSNLFEYFSSKTSCISTSSGMDDTENSEFLLKEFPLGNSWSRLPVEKLNAPPRGLEPEPGLPLGSEDSSHCRRRRRDSCIWSSMAENVLEMYDNTSWLSSDGSSFRICI